MHCSDFLEWYSDYRDGLVTDPGVAWQLRRHLQRCDVCARYDQLVRRGVLALRRECDIEPSSDFRARLRERLAGTSRVEPEPPTPRSAPVAAALMVAAAMALFVYESIERARPGEPPAMAQAAASHTLPLVVANPGVPFVTFSDLRIPAVAGQAAASSTIDVPLVSWASLPR